MKKILDDLLLREPGNAGAQLALARVSEAQGDVAGSRAALEAAIKARPSAIEPSLMLASLGCVPAGGIRGKALDGLIEHCGCHGAGRRWPGVARPGDTRSANALPAGDRSFPGVQYWFSLGAPGAEGRDSAGELPASAALWFARRVRRAPEH
jgi:hypothetical protein